MKLRSVALAGALASTGLAAGTAAPAAAEITALPVCVDLYDSPDAGLAYCYDAQGSCVLRMQVTTSTGTQSHCVVRRPLR